MRQSIRELKDKRVSFVFRPSTIEAAKKVAYMTRQPFNDVVNMLLEQYVDEHTDLIAKYDQIFGEDDRNDT